MRAAGLGTPNANPFGYAQYTVFATAPVGTVSVRARASMIDAFGNPAGGGQAFVVDAFVLTAGPSVSVPDSGSTLMLLAGALGTIGWFKRRFRMARPHVI